MRVRDCLLLAALAIAPPLAAGASTRFAWPAGIQAAVSLGYDDALASQLDHAVPALDKHGLKASFHVTLSSPVLWGRLDEWRALARNGHELGNHSLFHQCRRSLPGRGWVTADRDLDHTRATDMLSQVRLGNALLKTIDGKSRRTFALPCGDRLAHGEDYLALLREDFVAAKVGDGAVVPDMLAFDTFAVGVVAPSEVTGAQLIAFVQQAQARGTMVNFTFHGIGGDYLGVSTQAHDELLAYLAAHRERVWTDTFINLVSHVQQQQSGVASPRELAVPAGYRLAWADEFEGVGLPDPANWSYDTDRNKAGWRGKREWTYGFASVRARLPCGMGTWPAIWTLGAEGDWPARGELDIMEQLGKDPGRILSTVHTTAGSGANGKGDATQLADACTAFHEYQMLWTPEEVRFGIDGKEHFVYRNERRGPSQWPFDKPHYLLLNLAIGGDLGGPVNEALLPVTMEVDHVRVWQRP